jgi:hypothetical protein
MVVTMPFYWNNKAAEKEWYRENAEPFSNEFENYLKIVYDSDYQLINSINFHNLEKHR